MENIWKRFDIFLFDGGEGAGATGGEGTGMDAASQRAEGNAADAAQDNAGETRDMDAEWKKMINGEFKDFYSRDTQKLINSRFRDHKTLQERDQKYAAIAEKLAGRYGKDARDLDGLSAALDGDMQWKQEKADELGMTVEQYDQWTDQKQKAAKYDAIMDQRHQEEEAARWIRERQAEADALKQKIPAFDLDSELQNEEFANLIRHGFSMEHAWKALHYDDSMQGMAKYAAEEAERQTVENIRARGMRPKEGAAGGSTAVRQTVDPNNMTRAQRDEIERKVMRGEKFSFN